MTSDTRGQPTTAGWPRDLADWLALKDRALDVAAEGITIADARQPDRPLIFVNRGFERMTGYPVVDVLGRNCRFLHSLRKAKQALEHDRRPAARVQQALLPPPEFQAGDLRIAHAFHPCDDLAGDGVGVVSLPDDRLGIYLLDVSGHGVGAALLSFTLAHLLSPTLGGSLLIDGDGAGAGLPVGVIDEATYDDEALTLQPGDRVYCYTDGAIEALNAADDEFGVDRPLAEIDSWRGLPLRAGLERTT